MRPHAYGFLNFCRNWDFYVPEAKRLLLESPVPHRRTTHLSKRDDSRNWADKRAKSMSNRYAVHSILIVGTAFDSPFFGELYSCRRSSYFAELQAHFPSRLPLSNWLVQFSSQSCRKCEVRLACTL